MFTSGSTGAPKGVVLGHGALDAFFADIAAVHDVPAGGSCLNSAPPFFDVTVLDTWFPLARGARVRLTRPAELFPPRLVHLLLEERISHLCMVAPLVKLVAQSGSLLERVRFDALRSLMTGAERPDPAAVQRWLAAAPHARVLNGYGPTEATCVCLLHSIGPHNAAAAPYPIGGPLANVSWWLEREGATTRAPGADGELLVGGPQLMLGYLGDPDATRARIVEVAGAPHYRTGDLCRVRADGALEFLGRADEEVKLSGYRIHLGEVTAAALAFPGTRQAFATLVDDAARGAAIALALVSAEPARPLDRADLDAFLGERLPGYMRPRHVLAFDAFPSLPSGKLDGAALRREVARRIAP
jgi:non-ribosomal peptide synthetase component F